MQKRIKPWMFVSAAWILPAVFAMLNLVMQGRLSDWGRPSLRELLWAGGDWFLYALLTPVVFAISRRRPVTRGNLHATAPFHLVMALLFCVAWATLGKIFQMSLGLLLEPGEVYRVFARAGDHATRAVLLDWVSWVFVTFPFGTGVYLCMTGIEHATRYFVDANERAVQVSTLSAQLADARLSSLQAQLNPHFLFNALNTINVFVRDGDNATATRVIEQLSEVLRTTLDRSRGAEVRLGDEIELVRDYLAVEAARFSDRLRPELHIDDDLAEAAVPAFVIQHLVENALRHGIARRTDSGRVEIRARRDGDMLEIIVRDDGTGMTPGALDLPGHGLENTRERLRTLHGDRASLEIGDAKPQGTIVRLRFPYRTMTVPGGRVAI